MSKSEKCVFVKVVTDLEDDALIAFAQNAIVEKLQREDVKPFLSVHGGGVTECP